MVGIVLSPEQVREAPPAVRAWLERQLTDFTPEIIDLPARAAPPVPADFDPERLAACSMAEVMEIFERIRGDGLACRVLLEFGREPVAPLHASPLYALDLADIIAAAGISRGNQLVAALNLINAALQALRSDPEATLFAFDSEGRCYVHELTHRALHLLHRDLVAHLPAAPAFPSLPITCDPPYRVAAS